MWFGLPLLVPVYLALALVGVREYAAMVALRDVRVRRKTLWVASVLMVPAALPSSHPWMASLGDWGELPWRTLLLIGLLAYLLIAEVITGNDHSLHSLVFTLFGFLWIPFSLSFIITLRYLPNEQIGAWGLIFPMLAVIAADVGGFVFGSWRGKRPLAPRISPHKTIEGLWGALGFALFIVLATTALLPLWTDYRPSLPALVVFGLLLPMAAVVGDLFESLIKRWTGVKDAGVFLPGHGGVLDRIDSALIALPLAYVFASIFPWIP